MCSTSSSLFKCQRRDTLVLALRVAPARGLSLFFCSLLLLVWVSGSSQPVRGQIVHRNPADRVKTFSLIPAKPLQKEFESQEIHSYRLSLTAGEYVKVVVKELSGFNVLVTLTGPDKSQRLSAGNASYGVDNPFSQAEALKTETLEYVAEESGVYQLQLQRHELVQPAVYEIELIVIRSATESDRRRSTAVKAFTEGEWWRLKDFKPESLQQSIKMYEQALSIWRAIGDKQEEANTLNSLGFVYYLVRSKESAFEYYRQASEIWRVRGDLMHRPK